MILLNAENEEGEDLELERELEDQDEVDIEDELFDPELEVCSDRDTDDDEYRDSRKKIEAWNAKALSIARELQKKVIEEGLSGQNKPGNEEEVVDPNGFVSDYESSGDELQFADEADDHCIRTRKEKKKSVVVNSQTDFSKFKWSVGIRFANRHEFRECVVRYAVAQGRNLTWVVSDKGRNQGLGVNAMLVVLLGFIAVGTTL
ncbi:E3 ubiquitin-protein ligase TTC3 [Bienertia sinuspersici]